MTVTRTVLFDPPVRFTQLEEPIRKYLFTLQNLLPLNLVDTTTGNAVISLPPAGLNASTGQSNQNQELTYRKISGDVNTVTINGSPDGAQVLTSHTGAASRVRFKSDATDWWVVG